MTGTIALGRIRVLGRHGANPGERDVAQPFEIDLELDVALDDAARSDLLADTIDYAALHADIVRIVRTASYALLERLASDILARALTDGRVRGAQVRISKPGLLNGATPSVTLRRAREP